MKSTLATVFMILAGLGFIASLIAHIASIAGMSVFPKQPWVLHAGIFVVWLPAIIFSQILAKDFPQNQVWKAVLRGCPKPMQYFLYGIFVYAFLNFAFFVASTPGKSAGSAETIRGFSGHWLIFYYAAFAILYSYIQVQKQDPVRRCHNGHLVSPSAKYCGECGASVGDILADSN